MNYIRTFKEGLFQFLNRFLNPSPSWKSSYDVWMRCQQITSAWRKVCCRYDYWRVVALGYFYDAEAMMGHFARLISQCFDAISQGYGSSFMSKRHGVCTYNLPCGLPLSSQVWCHA